MTAQEFKISFLVHYDKIMNFASPGYEDSEIELFLNNAQLEFVKRRYYYKGNKYKEGVEETEKRRKDLSRLFKNADLDGVSNISQDQSGISLNGIFFDLPSDLMYTLREEITVSSADACMDNSRIFVKPVTHDEYSANIENPFKKPDHTKAWRLDFKEDEISGSTKKRHEIIPGEDYTVKTYHVRYIKFPRNISFTNNITSELDESTHDEILKIAVRMASGITDPVTYNIKSAEENLVE